MTANLRKALFAAIPIIVSAIAAWGYTTQAQAALLGTTLTATVGFAWALSRATGNRLLDAGVRRALYAMIVAAIATVGGWAAFDVALISSIIMSAVGAVLAIWNVDPDEQAGAGDGLGVLDGHDDRHGDDSPRRALRLASLIAVLVLAMSGLAAQPAEAAAVGCRVWATNGIRAGAVSICDGKGGANRWHRPVIWCRDLIGVRHYWVGDWAKGKRTSSVTCDYLNSRISYGVETT